MRDWWPFRVPRWQYVATVRAWTYLSDEQGNKVPGGTLEGNYILEECSNGRRRYTLIGDHGRSPFAIGIQAAIEAWKRGGPLPAAHTVVEKPPPARKKAKLIAFPGGKARGGDDA